MYVGPHVYVVALVPAYTASDGSGVVRFLALLAQLRGRLGVPLTLFLLQQRAAALVPGRPGWLDEAAAMVNDYVRADPRPAVRAALLQALQTLFDTTPLAHRAPFVRAVLVPALADAATAPLLLDPDPTVTSSSMALALDAVLDAHERAPRPVAADAAAAEAYRTAVAPLERLLLQAALADDDVGRAAAAARGLVAVWETVLVVGPSAACVALFQRLLQVAAPEPPAPSGTGTAPGTTGRARMAARAEVLALCVRLRARPAGRVHVAPPPPGAAPARRTVAAVAVEAGLQAGVVSNKTLPINGYVRCAQPLPHTPTRMRTREIDQGSAVQYIPANIHRAA
jgi:hypothetical protein